MFKKKQAMKRGGVTKKRGGGMMGPKKKMAKGGALEKARARKPSGRINLDDLKRAKKIPTGRSAAAKKLAGKGKATATIIGRMKEGKGNPVGKDMSLTGRIRALLGKRKPKAKGLGALGKAARRKAAGKKK